MTDKAQALFGEEQTGQSAPVSPPVEPSKPTPAKATLPESIDEDALAERVYRKLQSKQDKFEARVNKQLQDLRTAGVEVTAQVEQAVRSNITVEDDQAPASPVSTPRQVAQPKEQEPDKTLETLVQTRDAVYAEMSQQGITAKLTPGDPEVAEIDDSTPERLRETMTQALQKKAQRVTNGAQSRVPVSLGSGPRVSADADAYRNEMISARGNKAKVQEIQEKYRNAGLDVDHTPIFRPG